MTKTDKYSGYFGILPAHVRYHKTLPPKAKLLYADISALTRMNGWCYISDADFAELYDAGVTSIEQYIQKLEKAKLIEREYDHKKHERRMRCIFYTEEEKSW